ncbi:MAG TPA: hypothetical protein VN696_14530 [Pyrinomonadaceae bacterium]|nr:hypothetical protein [Pyrinomonadaceae bacterium]
MNKFRLTIKLLVTATFLLAFASLAQAQATRTWVSGVGDDVNPCSRTAPCKTFAGAISKTAAGGEIDALDPGGFGAVTITKSITLDGTWGAGFGSILSSGVNGVNVNDSATGTPNTIIVTLRKLSINGAGTTLGLNGVNFTSGKAVNVESCQIFNFSQQGINMSVNNTGGSLLHVSNTDIYNVNQGIRATNAGTGFAIAVINGANIRQITGSNASGIRLENNGFGDIRDAVISFALNGASAAGITITGVGSASISNTQISRCNIGLNITAASTNRITGSQIIQNGIGVQFAGGGSLRSYGDNVYDQATNFSGGAISPQVQQ